MGADNKNFEMWKYVLALSETMIKENESGLMNKVALIDYLNTIEETFVESRDPIENFEGYVLVQLCRSFRQSLESL